MKKILIHTSLSVLAAAMLTGCFSHGDAEGDTGPADVTKVFADAPVEGLTYSCAGGADKLTNAAGEFTCKEGDTVTFSIGSVVLGSLTAASSSASELSPYDLSDDNGEVVNIAQLIQSSDDDGVLVPTIVIDPATAALFDDSTITVDSGTFDADANATLGGTLVSNEDAEAHLIGNAPDTTAPVVTLEGAATVSILEGTEYIDEGATAEDNKDGVIDPKKSGDVDTAVPGDYTVTWTATDAAGNEGTATRTVTVAEFVDTEAPVVTLLGDAVVVQNSGHYVDAGATAIDDIDGDLVPVADPALDATSAAGVYTVTYTATDAAGNEGTATREVTINECQNVNPITGGCEDSPL